MCEETKEDMKAHTLGSWKQAVMRADAAWLKKWRHRGQRQQESVVIFMPLKVCSCDNCADKEKFECEGKDYYFMWYRLTCPFHSLVYEIECDYRASMADSFVHPVLKRGHSNWLEASHNIFIRFRSKNISLERLHYEVSTNLGLLQSNMIYMYEKRGPNYHWISDL